MDAAGSVEPSHKEGYNIPKTSACQHLSLILQTEKQDDSVDEETAEYHADPADCQDCQKPFGRSPIIFLYSLTRPDYHKIHYESHEEHNDKGFIKA